jgi:hypothetical protein
VGLRHGAAKDGNVLAENKQEPPIHSSATADDTVTGKLTAAHTRAIGVVLLKNIRLFERALIEQQLNALPRGKLPFAMLRCYPFLPAAK